MTDCRTCLHYGGVYPYEDGTTAPICLLADGVVLDEGECDDYVHLEGSE